MQHKLPHFPKTYPAKALAMRSRRDQDFIEYFTGAICSVPQSLLADDYVFVSQALLQDGGWEKVKALSMLALAAHSYK